MKKIIIYTDGGCRGNPGIGGWGVWIKYGSYEKKLQGKKQDTTNNRMELTAVIKALEEIKVGGIMIELFTDSKYVINGINEWIKAWELRNWKTANKKPVKNIDLWQQLHTLNKKHNISWNWVKGHSGDKGNEIADGLANAAMDNKE